MRLITPTEIQPVVRIANYIDVTSDMTWLDRRIPDLEFILVVEGEYEYLVEGQKLNVPAGNVLFIEPGLLHSKRLHPHSRHGILSAVHLELIPDGSWVAGDYRLTPCPEIITPVEDFQYMRERFWRLANVYRGYLPYREQLIQAIVTEILIILSGHWQRATSEQISAQVQCMIDYIRQNLTQPLSRQDLAHAFHITPAYVNTLFRSELGTTPSALINRERVVQAFHLLYEQGLSVKEAALAVGYQDPFYFSRVFKQIMGYAPSQVTSQQPVYMEMAQHKSILVDR